MEQALKGHKAINNVQVYYEFYPKQSTPTIVLLHGFLSSSFTFRHLIPLLAKDFQVLSVDIPPFGKSGKSKHFFYSYKNIANTIIQLTESFGLKDLIFIGHSMGGQIVLNILHYMPKKVLKSVLISSSSYLKRAPKRLIFLSYIPFAFLIIKYWLARTGVKKNLEITLYNHSLINEEMIHGYEEPFLKNDIFAALCRLLRHREGDLPAEALNEIQTPCLLIWGEHDKSVPLHIGERLNNDLVHSDLIVFKETGHAVPEERPRELYQHIKTFLADSMPKQSTSILGIQEMLMEEEKDSPPVV
jgi:pimeloyl-ACP methyl ester carboxylesterase